MKQSFLLFILFFSFHLFSQNIEITPESFKLTGDAFKKGENCFQLTSANTWEGGTVWYNTPVNLNESFEIEIDLKFGCSNMGADGIVFIFHDKLRTGEQGGGMGFGRLKPSLGIEMDTYQNYEMDDPEYDHISIMKNGNLYHYDGLTRAIPILPGRKNIEDCKLHRTKVSWNAEIKTISITIDGSLRIEKEYDIVGEIFRGNPEVYWGFSAATGGSHNVHEVCLEKLEFSEVGKFEKPIVDKLLKGEGHTLEGVEFLPSKTALKPDALAELDKVVQLMKSKKNLNIAIQAHTDSSGGAKQNEALSQKRADAVTKYLIEKGIDKKRINSKGYGEKYPKATNGTVEGRRINRRIDVYLIDPRA